MATTGTNNLADNASFHQNTAGYTRHLNLDTNNSLFTNPVNGLSIESIADSGDGVMAVEFDSGDDLSEVMKFSHLVLRNTTDNANNGTFEVISVDNDTKIISVKNDRASITAQAEVGGVGDVIPLQGANYIKVLENDTTFSSLVEHTDFIGGDEDALEGLTLSKNDFEFGFFTEIVLSAGKLRVALL
jgi:hypothetical protein